MDTIYGFWNNKGGTGKTSLCFQSVCFYAHAHPDKRVLVMDMCPQANLSEVLLGGLINTGSTRLLERQATLPRATIGGYFQLRLPSPYAPPKFDASDFITHPAAFNEAIPENVDLVCGDPLLELQSNAISTLANTQIPGTNAWLGVIDWGKDFLDAVGDKYDVVFIDANPSFSMYTQIALASVDRLVLPVMADDSSRRAIQNAFSLIFGFKLPSPIYATYAFATRLADSGRNLPRVHLVAKNRLTQYMGPASAYAAVLRSVEEDIARLLQAHNEVFTFNSVSDGTVDIRDFQTTGVVAFARGVPFYNLGSGRLSVMGQRVSVKEEYRLNCVAAMEALAQKL